MGYDSDSFSDVDHRAENPDLEPECPVCEEHVLDGDRRCPASTGRRVLHASCCLVCQAIARGEVDGA